MHFQTWQDKAGNAPPLTDPTNGLVFPDLNSPPFGGALLDQSNHARAVRLSEPVVEAMFGHPAGLDRPRGLRRDEGGSIPHRHGAVPRPIGCFLYLHDRACKESR